MLLQKLKARYGSNASLMSLNPAAALIRRFSSTQIDAVEAVYRIIVGSNSPQDLKESIKSSGVLLSNDLIDGVLKRFKLGDGNPLKALQFFSFTASRSGFSPSPCSLHAILSILCKSHKFDDVWDVLMEIKRKNPTLLTPQIMQVVLVKNARCCTLKETLESFNRFKDLVPVFDTDCFNALLWALCEGKGMVDATIVYHRLQKHFVPNLRTFNILISGCKSVDQMEPFLEEMREFGIRLNAVSYNSLIDKYCKRKEIDKAFELVKKMREESVLPDAVTYTTVMGGLGSVSQLDRARDVWKEMLASGCSLNVVSYNAAIKAYCNAKSVDDAYKLMEEMVGKGINPNSTTYHVFFRTFHLSNDLSSAWSFYRKIMDDGCFPDGQSCVFLFKLFKKHKNIKMALSVWNDMIEKDFGSCTSVADVLFELLCNERELAEAEKCFFQMLEKGHKPSDVSFNKVKRLMVLTNNYDAFQNLSDKMAKFLKPE